MSDCKYFDFDRMQFRHTFSVKHLEDNRVSILKQAIVSTRIDDKVFPDVKAIQKFLLDLHLDYDQGFVTKFDLNPFVWFNDRELHFIFNPEPEYTHALFVIPETEPTLSAKDSLTWFAELLTVAQRVLSVYQEHYNLLNAQRDISQRVIDEIKEAVKSDKI